MPFGIQKPERESTTNLSMKKQEILKALGKLQPGSLCVVTVNREALTRAATPEAGKIRKETIYHFQLCAYANRKPVRKAIEAGLRDEPELPRHIRKSENAGNGLKFWIGYNGVEYLALPVFGDRAKFTVTWTRDGKPVNVKDIWQYLTAEERRSVERAKYEKKEREAKGQAVARGVKLTNVKSIS